MLSPDQLKGYADIAVSLLGAGGFGAIILAFIGVKKASSEPPPAPSVGPGGMAHLAGMMVGEHFGMELLARLEELTDGVRELARSNETAARAMRECSEERRGDARRLSERIEHLAEQLKAPRVG